MTNWMRRRIERSRARCEKAKTNNRTNKTQTQSAPPQTGARARPDRNDS